MSGFSAYGFTAYGYIEVEQPVGATTLSVSSPTFGTPTLGQVVADLLLHDRVLDQGLVALADANELWVSKWQSLDWTNAGDNKLGHKTFGAGFVGAPAAGTNARKASVPIVLDGTPDVAGTPTCWQVVDTVNNRVLASGRLTGGRTLNLTKHWKLDAFEINIPKL